MDPAVPPARRRVVKHHLRAVVRLADLQSNEQRERHQQTIEELFSTNYTLPFQCHGIEETTLRFDRVATGDSVIALLSEDAEDVDGDLLLSVSAEVELSQVWDNVTSSSTPSEILGFLAAQELNRAMSDLMIAANIARPSSLEINGGVIVSSDGGKILPVLPQTSMLDATVTMSEETGWPLLRTLSIVDVWHWLRLLPGFVSGQPTTPAGRAVAALSHQFKGSIDELSPLDLVWVLVGLEALYGTGREGLKTQLLQKCETLLGRPTSFKKRLAKMYDFRSRLVHGDVDIPLAYYQDGAPGGSPFGHDVDEALSVGHAVLIASLQELVFRGWGAMRFQYVVDAAAAYPTGDGGEIGTKDKRH